MTVESLAVATRRIGIPVAVRVRHEGIEWTLGLGVYNSFEHLFGYTVSKDGGPIDTATMRAGGHLARAHGEVSVRLRVLYL